MFYGPANIFYTPEYRLHGFSVRVSYRYISRESKFFLTRSILFSCRLNFKSQFLKWCRDLYAENTTNQLQQWW